MNSFTSKLLQIANKAGALSLLNILYIICCLPLVTIGAACTALYTCIFLMPDSKDGHLVRTFFFKFQSALQAKYLIVGWNLCIIRAFVA